MPRSIKVLFRSVLILLILSGVVLYYARYIEPSRLRVEEINISSPFVSENADGIRILVFADTHFGAYYSTKDFAKPLRRIIDLDPDMVIFLGDLIDDYREYPEEADIEEIHELLAEISAPLGKFAIFGNHDYGGGAESVYPSIMADSGFRVLVNETVFLEAENLQLIGIDDVVIGYGDPSVASIADQDAFNIVLSHVPDIVDSMLSYPVDLVLAGHTHGRQVDLHVFEDLVLPPYGKKYIHGLYSFSNERNTRIYVNSGLGTTKLPLRLLSVPELTLIKLGSS